MTTVRCPYNRGTGDPQMTAEGKVLDFYNLTWGDQITLTMEKGEEQHYTVLVAYYSDPAEDPSADVVCLAGHHDRETMDVGAGDEVYLNITPLPDGGFALRVLEDEERDDVEQDFYSYFLLIGAIRTTTSEQPVQRTEEEWTLVVDEKTLVCRRVTRATYGVMGENTADVFMGSEDKGDDEDVETYLIFIEVLEEDPLAYGPMEEEDRDQLHLTLLNMMGYEDLDDDLEDDEDDPEGAALNDC
ncbi:MAG: hypothetical protein AAB839_02170 [Patescibacteria group bacterium]